MNFIKTGFTYTMVKPSVFDRKTKRNGYILITHARLIFVWYCFDIKYVIKL